jgi:TonB family protein
MKYISKFVRFVSLLAIGVSAPFAFGLATNDSYIASYQGRTDIPVPVKVVAPDAGSSSVGTKVEVEFLVDASGKPQDIHVLSATDSLFGRSVREAVSQWKFEPAKANGSSVATKVLLPVVVSYSD